MVVNSCAFTHFVVILVPWLIDLLWFYQTKPLVKASLLSNIIELFRPDQELSGHPVLR